MILFYLGWGKLPPSQCRDSFPVIALVDNLRILYELWFLIVFMPGVTIIGYSARDYVWL